MLIYPKIETLYDRDPGTFKVLVGKFRKPEFGLIRTWAVTEKIDGTNIRIILHADGKVSYGGRTENAQMFAPLLAHLMGTFPPEKFVGIFDPGMEVVLFGEGYGPKIQKGGVYRKTVSFRLFDVAIAYQNYPGVLTSRYLWLDWENVVDIAQKLGVATVYDAGLMSTAEATDHARESLSATAMMENDTRVVAEGIVARTVPLLLDRNGNRIMWKLKAKDFFVSGSPHE